MAWSQQIRRTAHQVERRFDDVRRAFKERFGLLDPLQISAHRGFGTARHVEVGGRVLEESGVQRPAPDDTKLENFIQMLRRFESDEIPNTEVHASFAGLTKSVLTNDEGYYSLEFELPEPLPRDQPWHQVSLSLEGGEVSATSEVLVPTEQARFVVISDVDDTVIRTGATSFLRTAKTCLLNNARTRTPFEGVADFYGELSQGGTNPIFYLSSSPWNLYDLIDGFLEIHCLPKGPILLRDWGLDESKILLGPHSAHKVKHGRHLLELYSDLPFVLIGDSGEDDPAIYLQLAEEHPGRIAAIFIREIEEQHLDEVDRARELGVPTVLVRDSEAALRSARELGLV